MFIKSFRNKSNIQLKSSDRKRLRDRVAQQFGTTTDDDLSAILPAKSSLSLVKVITHGGTTLNVYVSDRRPVFFESSDARLFPTVYTLWLAPNLLPEMTTQPRVLHNLSNGADLMLPGVVKKGQGMRSWGTHKKDEMVLVNLTTNRAAVGVGTLARSSEDMYMAAGTGVCVRMAHVFGDKLWSMDPAVCLQIPQMEITVALPTQDDFPALGANPAPRPAQSVDEAVQQLAIQDDSVTEEEAPSDAATPQEPDLDAMLRNAFLTALKLNGKTLQLPVLFSNFYALHVIPAAVERIDIKKTTFKKVSTFLRKMADEGFLEVREETKGVEKISAINLTNDELVNFVPKCVASKKDADAGTPSAAPMIHLTEMTEIHTVNENVERLFTQYDILSGQGIETTAVKKYIKNYIMKHKLTDLETKLIRLDAVMAATSGLPESEAVTYDNLVGTIFSRMPSNFEMRSVDAKKAGGKQPMIQISLANRSGNKKVTLVNNLESYGIVIPEFAKACKVGVAASTSMTKTASQKTDQFLVQGNQVRFIVNLLTETYKIPPRNIIGLELAKKEKSAKKKK